MEKIIRLKKLIDEALAAHEGFYPVYSSQWDNFAQFTKNKILSSGGMQGDAPPSRVVLKLSEALKTAAAEYLIDFQREFIEARNKAENSTAFLKKELERIEGLFSLPTYSVELPVRVRDGKTQKELRIEKETFYYDFDSIEADLPNGRIKGECQHGVISILLATANFYLWLKELTDNEQIDEKLTPNERTLEHKQKLLILEYLGIIDKLRGDGYENKELAQLLGVLIEMKPTYLQTELSTSKEKRENKKNLERIIEVFGDILKIRQIAEKQLKKTNSN
jgi:hypothetical protein